jgi:hypothetical protein
MIAGRQEELRDVSTALNMTGKEHARHVGISSEPEFGLRCRVDRFIVAPCGWHFWQNIVKLACS